MNINATRTSNADGPSLWSAAGLGLAVAVGNGFARFAYALLLPAMRDDLKWTYTEAGWMNTANALGYVAGAISGYLLLRRSRPSRLFILGLLLTVLALLLTGLRAEIAWLTLLRIASGIGAAWVFACGGALVTARFQTNPRLRGTATGIYFAGAGVGIAVSGVLIDPVLSRAGSQGWPIAWVVLGVASAIASIWPVIEANRISGAANSTAVGALELKGMYPSLLGYFLFACGYIIYTTFIFAWIRSQHMSMEFGIIVWGLLGIAVIASPFVWRRALDTWNPAVTLAASCAVTLLGIVVAIVAATTSGILLSAVLFGLGMFIAPSSVTVLTRRLMPPNQWALTITLFTAVFSVGQAIGPVLAGWIADRSTLSHSLGVGAVFLCAASLVALLRRAHVVARIAQA